MKVGAINIYTYSKESNLRVPRKLKAAAMSRESLRAQTKSHSHAQPHGNEEPIDPELEALVREIISRVADKWTMLILEVLAEYGCLRFTRLRELVGEISQKMLTQTLRQMEADGLLTRTVFPVVPPRVEYELTSMGLGLGAAFCGVWKWAEANRAEIERSRKAFSERLPI